MIKHVIKLDKPEENAVKLIHSEKVLQMNTVLPRSRIYATPVIGGTIIKDMTKSNDSSEHFHECIKYTQRTEVPLPF